MENSVGSKTVGGLLAFLNQLVEKGRARGGVIKPLDTAVRKVFSTVGGDGWEQLDVSSVDVDDFMLRFGNMTNGVYTISSLSVYKSRVNKSLGWYKQFLSTPGWTPSLRETTRDNEVSKTKSPDKTKPTPDSRTRISTAPPTPPQQAATQPVQETGMISYPLPLESGKVTQLYLPVKLTQADARRIGSFVASLAFEDAEIRPETGQN